MDDFSSALRKTSGKRRYLYVPEFQGFPPFFIQSLFMGEQQELTARRALFNPSGEDGEERLEAFAKQERYIFSDWVIATLVDEDEDDHEILPLFGNKDREWLSTVDLPIAEPLLTMIMAHCRSGPKNYTIEDAKKNYAKTHSSSSNSSSVTSSKSEAAENSAAA